MIHINRIPLEIEQKKEESIKRPPFIFESGAFENSRKEHIFIFQIYLILFFVKVYIFMSGFVFFDFQCFFEVSQLYQFV